MKSISYLLSAIILTGLIAGGGYYLSGFGAGLGGLQALAMHPLTLVLVLGLLFAAMLPIALGSWRKLDEGQQEAQKWGWFWGAGCGLVLPLPLVLICLFAAPGTILGTDVSPEHAFVVAYALVFTSICLCYGIGWLIWWMRHR